MELQEAILKRRSVRAFTDYCVTDDEINQVLEAARWAPSWANTQTWEFIVIRDKDLIQKITETYSPNNRARSCSQSASVVIVACAKKGVAGYIRGEKRTNIENWFMFDLGSAVQNLSLKAHELGLGTVIVGLMDQEKCQELLSVPDDYQVVLAMPMGKPVLKVEPTARKPLNEFVHFDKF